MVKDRRLVVKIYLQKGAENMRIALDLLNIAADLLLIVLLVRRWKS
nr:MAG TPA: hypothetical protein [Caudoviricetes sp.]